MDQSDLKLLAGRDKRPQNDVLSVYLNVDQIREGNVNRGFEDHLKSMVSSVQRTITNRSELDRFRRAASRIEEFVASYRLGARGIVLFFDYTDGFFWMKELRFPVDNQIRWSRELFLLPLAAGLDEYEPYAVCLAGPVTHRLFVACCGEIEEVVEETFPSRQATLIQTVIIERAGPAHRIQRQPDEELRRNLRHIAKDIGWIVETRQLNRIILAGAPSITGQLRKLLPKNLVSRVIDQLDFPITLSLEQVLTLTLPYFEGAERATEIETVHQLMSAAARGSAVTSLESTLAALNLGRVSKLVCSDILRLPGEECQECGALFSVKVDSCRVCGATVITTADVVARAIERALRQNATIELVKGQAADSLKAGGGIGAFLKTEAPGYRRGSRSKYAHP